MKEYSSTSASPYIDASGLNSPLPVIYCKAALACLNKGETLIFKASDTDICREVNLLVKNTEYVLLDSWTDAGIYFFKLEKNSHRKIVVKSPAYRLFKPPPLWPYPVNHQLM